MTTTNAFSYFKPIAGAFLLFWLGGCSNTFFSGASSMRIGVDVYKGPLANDVGIQKGQLATILFVMPFTTCDMAVMSGCWIEWRWPSPSKMMNSRSSLPVIRRCSAALESWCSKYAR